MTRPLLKPNIIQKFIGYLIFLSIIPLLVVGISSYRISRSVLLEESTKYASEFVINQQEYLHLQLAQIDSLIANLSSVEDITNTLNDETASDDTFTNLATQARIGYILNNYSNLEGLVSIDIFTVNDQHYHVGDTLNVASIRTDVKDKIFAETINSDQFVLWIGIEDNVNVNSAHRKVITAAKVLTRIDRSTLAQEPSALILVNYNVDYLYDHFNRIKLGEGAYLMVVDGKNRIIYHPDKETIGHQIDPDLLSVLAEHGQMPGQQVSSFESVLDGQPMYINHIHSDINDWIIMSLIPISTLTAKTSVIGMATAVAVIISLFIVGLAALLYSRDVVTPIQQITQRFQEHQDGTLNEQARLQVRSQDEIGELVQWFNTFVENLAAKQRTEQALMESEKQYRGIFEAVTDGLIIINEAGIIVEANAAACQMHGYSNDTFVGLPPEKIIHPDYHNILPKLRGAIAPDEYFYADIINVCQDGTPLDVELHGTMIIYHGKPHQLAIIRDITERRKTEDALRHSEKLKSLGILAGGIAHDFNNLLMAMMAQSSVAMSKLPSGSTASPHIQKAIKAAERAADLTRQMLAYSGRGHFQRKTIYLNAFIQENLNLFQVALPKQVELVWGLPDPLPLIEGDQGQIQQVIMNLIINAAESMEGKNGIVRIMTGVQELAEDDGRFWQYTSIPLASGRYVSMTIEDNGCGMDKETISKIFDPFFTTKFTGRGLGLAAVLGIIRGHKGGLHVDSAVGVGTTFTVIFPAPSEDLVVQLQPTVAEAEEKGVEQGVILVIDDETAVLDAVTDILHTNGIETITAVNGEEGLAVYQQHQEKIKLILLDLSMPGISSEETYTKIKQINAAVHIIISSGFSETEIFGRFGDTIPFLQKPYHLDTLLSVVQPYLY
ncbi:MAG: PAS domain S-box protein [Ardenticatenaceae bacterium]|nr:PAS domain S-box protein [Ardenticatenaceae bacterium]